MSTVVYPGTFDPITNGHIDLVKRGMRLFDRVVVAVVSGDATTKQPLFTVEERVALAQEALKDHQQVEVIPFQGLLVEFARSVGAEAILRGLRAVSDFEYEFQLAGMNRHLAAEIETLFLTPSQQYGYLSSSMIREIAKLQGDIDPFVAKNVKQALEEKFGRGVQ